MRRLGLMLLLTATLRVVASAQETTGTITGVTSDQTGAVLPGVSVTVKNTNTATSRTVVTNEAGFYTASLLPVGTYEVSFELSGFQTVTLKNIDLHVNDRLKLDGHLSVGGVAESVEVTAGPVAGAADRRAAVDHDLDPGEGAAAQQPQLRPARDAGARRVERSHRRGRRRPHQHGQHVDQRIAAATRSTGWWTAPRTSTSARTSRCCRRRASSRSRSSRSSPTATRPNGRAAAAASSTS